MVGNFTKSAKWDTKYIKVTSVGSKGVEGVTKPYLRLKRMKCFSPDAYVCLVDGARASQR